MSQEFSNSLLDQVTHLPALPGVYRYFDEQGQLLYVGKAINLKKRVSSYFQRQQPGTRIGHMISKIARLEITIVRSEAEALILENNLIKTKNPKYNILFRDDKSYPYLKLTTPSKASNMRDAEQFSRISYYRGTIEKKHHYFGPYPSATSVKETILLLQKVFLLRVCEDSVFNHRSRPCLLWQIKRCSAPCVGHISGENYQKSVDLAYEFLQGKSQELLSQLQQQMQLFAQSLEFEKAAFVRNQIQSLSQVLHQQSMQSANDADIDILAVATSENKACVNLAMVRGGRHLGDRSYFPSQIKAASDWMEIEEATTPPPSPAAQVLHAFVMQHYLEFPPPATLISSEPIEAKLIDLLSDRAQRKITAIQEPHKERRAWLEIARQNAEHQLTRLIGETGREHERVQSLIEVLNLDLSNEDDLLIECFDISHTQGEATKASCVVYSHCQLQNRNYRRYDIKNITPGDDYAAMRQALERRYSKYIKKFESDALAPAMPNIIFIDGGKGQISSAKAVFEALGLNISLLVGVEKGENRKVGLEELVFADGREKLSLEQNNPGLLLIAKIRDEAHRFAITGMRAKRAKIRVGGGQLEEIPGIGPKRRSKLLQRFGGVRGVAGASIEDLSSVESISLELAQEIYRALH